MPAYLKNEVMAAHLVRPGVTPRKMVGVTVNHVVTQINQYMKDHSKVHPCLKDEPMKGYPEVDALQFYMYNHAVSILRQRHAPESRIPDPVAVAMNGYHRMLAVKSIRMFYYLLLICTRESRHEKSGDSTTFWAKIKEKFGTEPSIFWSSIKGSGSQTAVNRFLAAPPACELLTYTEFLQELFFKGKFTGGYGGPAWGAVAKVLNEYCQGILTAEMMMDTAFTLAHNNGPIFNKGMLFSEYSSEIYKILDVQRSGQIPQYVAEGYGGFSESDPVVALHANLREVVGEDFLGYVDWFKVASLGALKSYKSEQNNQVKKYGHPDLSPKNEAKAMPSTVKTSSLNLSHFAVFPGQYVTYEKGVR